MSALFCLVIACLTAVTYGWPTPHIVGGEKAKIGEFPYIVSLRSNNRHFCGGSIISPRHIITAAHCITNFVDSPHTLSVHAGTNFMNETGDAYTVEKVMPHKEFSIALLKNDIGMLRLTKNIEFKNTVKSIGLAVTKFVETGDPCVLCGWGRLKYMGKRPNDLQKLHLSVFSQTECKREFWQVLDSHVCAFSRDGQGACHGDSGSPLVSKGVQIGLASFVRPCGVGYPDVYTRVSAFKDWVAEHMKL